MIEMLYKYFSDIATWNVPKGGFYIWLQFQTGISTRKLFDVALREGILLNPGNVYDENHQEFLRLSYSYASRLQMEKGLKRLSELIKNEINNSN